MCLNLSTEGGKLSWKTVHKGGLLFNTSVFPICVFGVDY